MFSALSIYSVWIALASAFGPLLLCDLAGQPNNYVASILVFLVTFAIYSLDKVSGSLEDLQNTPERTRLARWPIKQVAACSYAAAVIVVLLADPPKLPYVLIPGIAGALYTARIAGHRPKDIPGLKNILVAAATALCYAGLIDGAARQYVLIFLLIFIDTVIFDMRDIIGDRANDVRTIPVMLGTSRTVALLAIACLMLALLSPIVAAIGFLLIWHFRHERDGWEYDLYADGWILWAYVIRILM
jgi:4-hydroxybenzoate polyprenyltransferase